MWVLEMLEMLQRYSGAITALLTIALVIITGIYAWLTRSLVVENRLLRKAGSDPAVVAYLLPDHRYDGVVNLVVANVGRGPAFDVTIAFEGDADRFAARSANPEFWPGRKHRIAVLPQDERYVQFFGGGFALLQEDGLGEFAVDVAFKSSADVSASYRAALSVEDLKGIGRVGEPPELVIANSLKKIEHTLERIALGWRTLRVETITPAEREERDRRAIEEQPD